MYICTVCRECQDLLKWENTKLKNCGGNCQWYKNWTHTNEREMTVGWWWFWKSRNTKDAICSHSNPSQKHRQLLNYRTVCRTETKWVERSPIVQQFWQFQLMDYSSQSDRPVLGHALPALLQHLQEGVAGDAGTDSPHPLLLLFLRSRLDSVAEMVSHHDLALWVGLAGFDHCPSSQFLVEGDFKAVLLGRKEEEKVNHWLINSVTQYPPQVNRLCMQFQRKIL